MQEEGITKYVGKQIRKYREIKGLTQKELGKRVGVQHNTISSYESGTNEPEHEVLFALAETLGVTIDDLFPSVAHKKDSRFNGLLVRSARKFYLVLPNFYPSPQIN